MMFEDPVDFIMRPTRTAIPSYTPNPTSFPTVIPDPPIFEHIGKAGTRASWVVFVLMVIAAIAFTVLARTVPASKRVYHSLTTLIVVISALTYFAQATGQGHASHHKRLTEHHGDKLPDTHRHLVRQVYYTRFIDWALTTPLLLINLSLLAGLPGSTIFSALSANVIFVLSGLFAAFSHRKIQVWGWFTISILAFLWIAYTLIVPGRTAAKAKGANVSRFYNLVGLAAIVVGAVYPIIWGIVDGSRILSVNGEIIAYAVLDVLSKGVFGGLLLTTYKRVPEIGAELNGFWASGTNAEGRIRIGDDDGA
ncbi:bacteriorhodopsin [Microthyrium microscopicum]|uniref:Bacteriorhodopsin n=1 Tax=Microthyrium microscopicum TaxID=703497 RepID=A0A6A6U0X7_9PEZI|nr:bacteriorhodopsin [Microthyrium microscopicum]